MDDNRERMSPALQENILALLCFDDDACKTIRVAVGTPKLFESKIYREIAGAAIDFIDQHKTAIKEHLADEMEGVITGADRLVAQQYEKLIKQLYAESTHINRSYVESQLNKFVRLQRMKSALIASVDAAEEGDIERVETLWTAALKDQVTNFEGGTDLGNADTALTYIDKAVTPIAMGIDVLDRHGIGPMPKTVLMLQAPLGRGKSWGLIHIGKWALIQRKCVVHITLEMSEQLTTQRYHQSLFGITKHDNRVRLPVMSKGRDGVMSDLTYEEIDSLSYADENIRAYLASTLRKRTTRWKPFRIKEFPSGSLTMAGLDAYLDGLERHEKIVPDVLIIDYAELMQLQTGGKTDQKRAAIGSLFVELRGLAGRRNLAVVTASQTNRAGINKTVSDETDTAEDISKGFTVDTIITYNQTKAEYELGLARLFVAKHRDGEGRQTALISQNYKSGQFCIDSVLVSNKHFEFVDRRVGRRRDDGEDGDER